VQKNESCEIHKNRENQADSPRLTIPKPVLMRQILLFGGGAGCLFVGVVAALAIGDMILLALSAILCVSFITKGFLLRRKIRAGQIYGVHGVCVGIAPKMFGRYRRIELVNTDTGDDASFVLPKKVVFKVGHVYTCYFDNRFDSGNVSDLPTNGFLGYEDFGVYQERPMASAAIMPSAELAEPEELEEPYESVETENEEESL